MATIRKIKNYFEGMIALLIFLGVAGLCTIFCLTGTQNEDGSITYDGKSPVIAEYTEKFIEDANDAMNRLMNVDKASDADLYATYDKDQVGLGFATTLDDVLGRRLPDGNTDNGLGWQCSKYTAYLATGQREYSTVHTDYGPVNGKDIASWLVRNYGFKYISTPVAGAIGSGGFNTQYGHTAMYLYSTGSNTAMVNDANYVPLTVSTHNMNIDGWVWVVPGNYEPTPTPTPTPTPEPVSDCKRWNVKYGDTLGQIMATCEGRVKWGQAMQEYAKTWVSTKVKPGQTVYEGWHTGTGIGLYAGDIIEKK